MVRIILVWHSLNFFIILYLVRLASLNIEIYCIGNTIKMQFDFNNHLNNEILQQNRLKARSCFIPYENKAANAGNIAGTKNTTRYHSLNGKWNFAYYGNIREAFDIVEQTYTDEISVPDVWQFAGYEKPFYINVAYPFPATPPYVPDCAPGAVYNRKFSCKKAKNLSRSIITFQGVSAGFDLFINGKYVGYSQGSHYPSVMLFSLATRPSSILPIVYRTAKTILRSSCINGRRAVGSSVRICFVTTEFSVRFILPI